MNNPPEAFELKGLHVLAIVVGFFLVVIAVDGGFSFMALKTFPGEVSQTPYEDGLIYDKAIAARERQAALGWSAEVETDQTPGVVLARFLDARGAPIDGLTVTGALQRPATQAGTLSLRFHPLGRGVYQAQAQAAAAAAIGGWDLSLKARDAKGRDFAAERRIVWP